MSIDPTSTKVVLRYTGNDAGQPSISGVPARDLTENDVARLVYVEHGDLSGAAFDNATDKIVDGLTDGPYRKTPAEPSAAKPKEK